MATWFEKLFGFTEDGYDRVQGAFDYDPSAGTLRSRANGVSFNCGTFSTPTLGQLRADALETLRRMPSLVAGRVTVTHIAIGDILEEHALHPQALFQAASQLNCLEMPGRSVTPEEGVTNYVWDRTQGPACAVACAAGTVVRNYFVDVGALACPRRGLPASGGPLGQREDRQINLLDEVEAAIGNAEHRFWTVKNGYLSVAGDRVKDLPGALGGPRRDSLLSLVKIGLQAGVGVTFARGAHVFEPPALPVTVSQAYCSAMPVEGADAAALAPVARLLLDGLYEATLWAAVLNAHRTGCHDVFLTFVGGGVWGNDPVWIAAAMARAVAKVSAAVGAALAVHICHFRRVDARLAALVDREIAAAVADAKFRSV